MKLNRVIKPQSYAELAEGRRKLKPGPEKSPLKASLERTLRLTLGKTNFERFFISRLLRSVHKELLRQSSFALDSHSGLSPSMFILISSFQAARLCSCRGLTLAVTVLSVRRGLSTILHVVGCLKGKSAIQIARKFGGRQKNFTGEHFWARGYFVSTVGLDENMVRAYIRNQEDEDDRYDQMKLTIGEAALGGSRFHGRL